MDTVIHCIYGPVNLIAPTEANEIQERKLTLAEQAIEKAKSLGLTEAEIAAIQTG